MNLLESALSFLDKLLHVVHVLVLPEDLLVRVFDLQRSQSYTLLCQDAFDELFGLGDIYGPLTRYATLSSEVTFNLFWFVDAHIITYNTVTWT